MKTLTMTGSIICETGPTPPIIGDPTPRGSCVTDEVSHGDRRRFLLRDPVEDSDLTGCQGCDTKSSLCLGESVNAWEGDGNPLTPPS